MATGTSFPTFDFEPAVEEIDALSKPTDGLFGSEIAGPEGDNSFRLRRNFRQTVCRHWLKGLCMKGENCGFLHQLDKDRMPVCRTFARTGECNEPDCNYKHSSEDIKDCNMYVYSLFQ